MQGRVEKPSCDSKGEVLLLRVLLAFAGLLPRAVPLENIESSISVEG